MPGSGAYTSPGVTEDDIAKRRVRAATRLDSAQKLVQKFTEQRAKIGSLAAPFYEQRGSIDSSSRSNSVDYSDDEGSRSPSPISDGRQSPVSPLSTKQQVRLNTAVEQVIGALHLQEIAVM